MFTGFNGTVDGESATTILFGEKTRTSPDGVSCDLAANPKEHFDSSLGRVSFDDRESLGACWEVNYINKPLIDLNCKTLSSFPLMPSCPMAALWG